MKYPHIYVDFVKDYYCPNGHKINKDAYVEFDVLEVIKFNDYLDYDNGAEYLVLEIDGHEYVIPREYLRISPHSDEF